MVLNSNAAKCSWQTPEIHGEARGKSEKEAIINSSIFSNFNYCPLLWHISSCEAIKKIKKDSKTLPSNNDYENDYETFFTIATRQL